VILRGPESAGFDALVDAGVVVVCGPGGVGKTTMAASIAARAAATRPVRVLVLTVDPARRLATALGLDGLGDRETPVPAGAFATTLPPGDAPAASVTVSPIGTLHAAMIDTKASWDDLVARHAPDAETRDRVLANPLYRNLTERFTASHDYVAMERLFEARRAGGYDLVVVDTPPSRNALDVLDAPDRMRTFFASRLLRALTTGSRGGLAALASRPIVEVARRILGVRFLDDVTEFFALLRTMEDGFVARAGEVSAMLRAPDARFVVVTTLEEPALGDATRLAGELRGRGYPLAAIVANRVLPAHLTPESLTAASAALASRPGESDPVARAALASVAAAARDAASLADAHRVALTALRAHAPLTLETPLLTRA
jgi:anion-transporting  ArsA/GET3 family ATPase